MLWAEVLRDKNLTDLPYKIELNEWGNIEMSPATNIHSFFQAKIMRLLMTQLPDGEAMPEFAIQTDKGVKVPDVVWCSHEFLQRHPIHQSPFQAAPELCIEVMSEHNIFKEMKRKMKLYFAKGAKEVWLAYLNGKVRFFSPEGEIAQSQFGINEISEYKT